MEPIYYDMDVVSSNHQPQNSLSDQRANTEGDDVGDDQGLKLWKSVDVPVSKKHVYKFGFELTIPNATDLCYFSPFDTKDKSFSQGNILELQSIYFV